MKMTLCPRCWGSKKEPKRAVKCTYCQGQGAVQDLRVSKYFSLSELTRSSTALRKKIPNDPSPEQFENLKKLGAVMDEIRWGVGPIRGNSALRQPDLNVAIGGSKTSVHRSGSAIDCVPLKMTLKEMMLWVVDHIDDLEIDQLIYEGTWIHIGVANPRKGQKVRRATLMMFGGKYFKFNPNDPRVV